MANEMLSHLGVEPPSARFPAEAGGTSHHMLINQSLESRLVVKVKCSDNNVYRVNPVYTLVEVGHSVQLEIIRLRDHPPKEDKLVIQYFEVPAANVYDEAEAVVEPPADPAKLFASLPADARISEIRMALIGD